MSQFLRSLPLAACMLASPLALWAQDADAPSDAPATEEAAPETPATDDAAPETTPDAPPQADSAAPETTSETPASEPDAGTAPTTELDMGQPATGDAEPGLGQPFVAGEFGDWEQRCVRTEDGSDPCQLYQLLRDQNDNPVAEMSIFALPDGQQAAAGSTIITPLETLLTQQITISVDGAAAKRYPFDFCAEAGCFARVGFTAEEIATFKRGNEARLTIVPAAAPDQRINLVVSLSGFTAGYDATTAANRD